MGCSCKVGFIVAFVVSVIIIIAVLVGTSIKKLEDYEMGLQFNPNAVRLNEDKLFTAGTHFLGPGHYFIKFNKNLRTIQFGSQSGSQEPDIQSTAINSRTADALQVSVVCSFQYRLSAQVGDLITLFRDWGEEYEKTFVLLARNILRDAMSSFRALEVFYSRTQVEASMRLQLQERLSQYFAIVESFQLLDLTLPSKFNSALVLTEKMNLEIETTRFLKDEEIQKSEGQIQKARQEAEVIINNAEAEASRIRANAEAKADSIVAKISEQKTIISNIKTDLKLNDQQLASYYFYEVLNFGNLGHINFNLDTPSQIQCLYDRQYCT